jgi:hypothetical protein
VSWRVCEHCGRRYINPGGHWEECAGAPQLELVPDRRIDPRHGQVTLTPGIDAVCVEGLTADTCRWPFCQCKFPDRT